MQTEELDVGRRREQRPPVDSSNHRTLPTAAPATDATAAPATDATADPTAMRSRRRMRGLEWFVIALLAVVELAVAGTRDGVSDNDPIEVGESSPVGDSREGRGLAAETP